MSMASISEDRPDVAHYPGGEGLYRLRHSAAHVLATAVTELFPDVKVAGGPPIENGFYYDFARDQPFTPEDLERIEDEATKFLDRLFRSGRTGRSLRTGCTGSSGTLGPLYTLWALRAGWPLNTLYTLATGSAGSTLRAIAAIIRI